ncbi:Bug family tripartite tricarboxylate transporter substrate binding protein [Acuticoccus mangrovi]|uniref:Tripartite tricarboxylate transporter substrate binding protein n=1 Tax=Acuticoccus mangrovi TaxID=2796142 RepID=A0A934MCT6_9HYPH|nr:tripartite tricarboxylate transporter substrate binding protein [Acuticoccus mangrovi]MBJ3775617.1 tripartite tricarboxylate transporter substrate binding protein [Acuticoccus mangrovi]
MARLFARPVMRALAALGLAVSLAPAAHAADPLTLIVPWGAGGSSDVYARTLALSMEKTLGTDIVILNRPGAAGTLGTTEVARAKPDGNTVGVSALAPFTMQPHLRHLAYDVSSFDYICKPYSSPMALVVSDDSDFKTLDDVIGYAKAHPGELKYGSPGPGSLPHLAMVELGQKAGVEWTHLPTQGGDTGNVRNLLGHHIDMVPIQIVPIASNPIRPLAVFTDERLADLPDVPTVKELGYDMAHVIWGAMFAPKGVDPARLAQLEDACAAAVASDEYQSLLETVKVPDLYTGMDETNSFAVEESDKFKRLLAAAGMTQQ